MSVYMENKLTDLCYPHERDQQLRELQCMVQIHSDEMHNFQKSIMRSIYF